MKRRKTLFVITVLNIALFVLSMFCLIGTAKNNRDINSIRGEFSYEELENGQVILYPSNGKGVMLSFGKNSVRVENSYEIKDREDCLYVVAFIKEYGRARGYAITRSNIELYGEYRLHNFAYDLSYKRSQTSDTDLDYKEDRRWYVNIASVVIGWCGF